LSRDERDGRRRLRHPQLDVVALVSRSAHRFAPMWSSPAPSTGHSPGAGYPGSLTLVPSIVGIVMPCCHGHCSTSVADYCAAGRAVRAGGQRDEVGANARCSASPSSASDASTSARAR
jgi:hypothetical protein